MNKQKNWVKDKLVWGLVLIALGLVITVVGFILPGLLSGIIFNGRLIPACGILVFIMGIASLAQYAYTRSNPKAARKMMIDERDERIQLIHAGSGNRAFIIGNGMAYFVLMWDSFASDVGLPSLTGDRLWFSLLALVLVPVIVYIGSIVYEQRNS
ncbi:MAG TPA: hypothetical protein VKF38_06975 [Anaerolineaceae bacterium]|nr:hypothetical protein [Anaerolineaceae bacterium]